MDFEVGRRYTRREVFQALAIDSPKGGAWFTGHVEHEGSHFIFCGIESAGRTGHDYGNHFVGDELSWHGRTGSKLSQPSVQELLSPGAIVRIFYRENDREAFIYAGRAKPRQIFDETPVGVMWSFADDPSPHAEFMPGEVAPDETMPEGAKKTVTVNIYERNPAAREKCIEHWGTLCIVCGFDFAKRYGRLGSGFIHVHHLMPLGEIGSEYELDPRKDLRPVCPNCHAMLHRCRPALSIEELRTLLRPV